MFTLTGTPNFSLTYTDGTTPVTISGITTNTYTVSVTPTTATTYSITALSDASCSAIASDITSTATINVVQRPTAILSGSTTICSGTTANLNIALTGDQPYAFTYTTNGSGPITISNISTANYTLTVSPTSTSTYSITALSIGGCSAIASDITGGPATVTVNQTPTATVTGTSTICIGSSATVNVALTGTAPYSFTYTENGINPVTVSNILTNSYSFTVSPTVNTTYSITSVTAAGCTGTGANIIGSAAISVTKVTASISGDKLICKGGSALLDVVFTGAAPYSFTYNDGTSNTTISDINTTTYQLEVTPPVSRTYSIVSAQGGSCIADPSDISGTATVTTRVVTAALSGSTTICSGSSTVISVALTGSSPWIVKYSDGTTVTTVQSIQTSPYTFSVSPTSSKNYTITEVKDTWCKAVSADVTGDANVTVVLSPAVDFTGTAYACLGVPSVLTATLTGGSPWTFTYNAKDASNNVVATTISGITSSNYTFAVSPTTTTTYSITALNNTGCVAAPAAIRGSATLTVNPIGATLSSTFSGSSCSGQPIVLNVTLTGNSPWSFNYSDGVNTGTKSGITNSNYSFTVSPTTGATVTTTTYRINSLTSGSGASACTTTLNSNLTVQGTTLFNGLASFSNSIYQSNANTPNYFAGKVGIGSIDFGSNLYVSGSTTIAGNLTVLGSATQVIISASTVEIDDNILAVIISNKCYHSNFVNQKLNTMLNNDTGSL